MTFNHLFLLLFHARHLVCVFTNACNESVVSPCNGQILHGPPHAGSAILVMLFSFENFETFFLKFRLIKYILRMLLTDAIIFVEE